MRVFLFLLLMECVSKAATITAASTSRCDVGAAVTAAVDGDTVMIPSGTSEWTTSLQYSKAISVIGSGTNLTILQDGIILNTPPSAQALFAIATTSGKSYRLSNLQIAQGSRGDSPVFGEGTIQFGGTSTNVLLDNIYINAP